MDMAAFEPLLPGVTEIDQPFWTGLERGEVQLQKCRGCDKHQHPAEAFCRHCGSTSLGWETVSAEAQIYAYTVVHRAPHPAFAGLVPYVSAIVQLDVGPRLLGLILEGGDRISIGVRLAPAIRTIGSRSALMFEPVNDA